MCDCIKKIEKQLTDKLGYETFIDSVIFSDGSKRFSLGAFYYEKMKNGCKKDKKVGIYPQYCPICGKPYNENKIKVE